MTTKPYNYLCRLDTLRAFVVGSEELAEKKSETPDGLADRERNDLNMAVYQITQRISVIWSLK